MRALVIAPIRLYRTCVSPLLGQRCRYHPSCSRYAIGAIEHHGALRGSVLAVWRVLRCNPWSRGGVDHPDNPRFFRS